MAQFLRICSTFYLHFKTKFNLKITLPYTYFLFVDFTQNLYAWFVKDCKQIFTMSITYNTQKQLLTEIHWPPHDIFYNYKYSYQNNPELTFDTTTYQHPHCFKTQFVTIFILPDTLDNLNLAFTKMDKECHFCFSSGVINFSETYMLPQPSDTSHHAFILKTWILYVSTPGLCLNNNALTREKKSAASFLLLPENIVCVYIYSYKCPGHVLPAGILLLNM